MPDDNQAKAETLTEAEKETVHRRADHEDSLFVSRTSAFMGFNGFIAAAIGFTKDSNVKYVFLGMVLLVDIAWALWAGRPTAVIRALRKAGKDRIDQQKVDCEKGRHWWWNISPLTIMTLLPRLLTCAWIAMLFYFILPILRRAICAISSK